MNARKPEDCDRFLVAACERGEMEAILDLYEPGAVLHKLGSPGLATTREEICEEFLPLLALKPKFVIEQIVTSLHADGTLATTRMRCTASGTDQEGNPMQTEFHTLEVVRKQADGSWKYAIDDPRGSARDQGGIKL